MRWVCDIKVGFVGFSQEMGSARQERERVDHQSRLVGAPLAPLRPPVGGYSPRRAGTTLPYDRAGYEIPQICRTPAMKCRA